MALMNSAFSFCTMGAGVLAAAKMPYQAEMSKPGTPDSWMVGTYGSTCERLAVDTPIARNLPA